MVPTPHVHGVVTTGSSWKFLQLKDNNAVVVDTLEYFIDNIGKIMGILIHMVNQG